MTTTRAGRSTQHSIGDAVARGQALCKLGELPLEDMSASISATRVFDAELADMLTAVKELWCRTVSQRASSLEQSARSEARSQLHLIVRRMAAENAAEPGEALRPIAKRLRKAVADQRREELPDAS